jgi:hypothetical protein
MNSTCRLCESCNEGTHGHLEFLVTLRRIAPRRNDTTETDIFVSKFAFVINEEMESNVLSTVD